MAATKKPATQPEVRGVFPAESTAELLTRLTAAGPGARLRVLLTTDMQYFLKVLPAVGAVTTLDEVDDINHAHMCPPNPPSTCAG